MEVNGAEEAFNRSLGGRLRAARRRRGLSLAQVEELSGAEFKASVVGAYERGERALSVHRLVGLARLYGISIVDLFPPTDPEPELVIDLDRIPAESDLVDRFLSTIQLLRRSPADGSAVRASDLVVLTSLIEGASQRR